MTGDDTDPSAEYELVTVRFGARSLRSRRHGETFHPVLGPLEEARKLHVGQQRLVERAAAEAGRLVIWDVGLGAAANAVAVLDAFREFRGSARIELHSFDATTAPLDFARRHADALGYPAPHAEALRQLSEEGFAQAGPVAWRLHHGDFRECLHGAPTPAAIFFDPYSPRANPEMWSLGCFRRVSACLSPAVPCLLTSYTRSTAVRVTLLLAGLQVGRGAPIAEKNETTIAANLPGLLAAPLDRAWLQRVRASTRSAPLDEEGSEEGSPRKISSVSVGTRSSGSKSCASRTTTEDEEPPPANSPADL